MEIHDPVSDIYGSVGSEEPFNKLVDAFYAVVENDLILRPLYPKDLKEPKRKLALFLIQRTGGRNTYSQERGHPRMRARHLPFTIGQNERDAWMKAMGTALDQVPEFAKHRKTFDAFFESFSTFLMNQI